MKARPPAYAEPAVRAAHSTCDGVDEWYAPVLLTAAMIGERAQRRETVERVLEAYRRIQPDDYVMALTLFYSEGLARYGPDWRYCDLPTALFAAAELIRPARYLEIGVRRGRSVAAVVSAHPACDIVGFDYWKRNYAGMETPGPRFVEQEVARLGHQGRLELITGNSHETVPRYLADQPEAWFDLVTVDGDHTPEGAADDLANVLPRLKVGGAILFDDISHPTHPELRSVWETYCGDPARFSGWSYTALGYGVGIAVRKV